MLTYIRKRRARGLVIVPIRYVFLAFVMICIGIQLAPAVKNTTVAAVDKITQITTPEDMQLTRESEQDIDFDAVIADADDSAPGLIKAQVNNRKIVAMLSSLAPAAGQPMAVSGVSLPEPRPAIFAKMNSSSDMVAKRINYIERQGVRPVNFEIKSGDTLADSFMSSLDVPYDDVQRLIGSLSDKQDPKDLRPGQKIKAYTVKNGKENVLMAAEIQKDVLNSVSAVRISENRFAVDETTKPIVKRTRAAKATIENSLYLAASEENVPDRLIVELIHALSWSVDFQRDIRANDEFEMMFEEYRTEDGELVPGKGNILYAGLKIGDKPYELYLHEGKDGQASYYEEDGQSIRKALMTTPINGARISSNFGRRKHPVLGYTKMHKGTDFAAPRGTPIYASGDGVIEYIGRRGSFGNYIKIRHRSDLHSAYAHMKGFKKGLANGHRVKQGDVIGYVGTTGRSTGPHLHYEVHLNGQAVNPKSIKLPTGTKLAGTDLDKFKKRVKNIQRMKEKYGLGKTIVASLGQDSSNTAN